MYDIAAVLLCYAIRFLDMFVRTNLETLGSPYAQLMYVIFGPAADARLENCETRRRRRLFTL